MTNEREMTDIRSSERMRIERWCVECGQSILLVDQSPGVAMWIVVSYTAISCGRDRPVLVARMNMFPFVAGGSLCSNGDGTVCERSHEAIYAGYHSHW